jgi:hypothetical protein
VDARQRLAGYFGVLLWRVERQRRKQPVVLVALGSNTEAASVSGDHAKNLARWQGPKNQKSR